MTGPQLNKIVWELFSKAGFITTPNSNDPSEHQIKLSAKKYRTPDLLAEHKELAVRIIGENKTGIENDSVTKLINDLAELAKVDRCQAALIVSIKQEFTTDDIEFAKSKKVFVWNLEKLNYYRILVETLGEYSKYEIIHSFGIETKEQRLIQNTLALKFEQPFERSKASIFVFTIQPQQLLKTCVIFRRAQGNSDAYQRIVKKKRLKSIKKFVSQENALLPTNILVYFSDSINFSSVKIPNKDKRSQALNLTSDATKLVNLKIPLKYGSMEILDGQHRLYGFLETDPATKKDFNLLVVGIMGLTAIEKRDTFIAINDNARRMDPNLVAFLKYTDDETECQNDNELMAIKVAYNLNASSQSPFKNKIRMLDIGNQIITLKGFAGYDLKGLFGKNSLLRKYHNNTSKEYISLLTDYFNLVKAAFKKEYLDPNTYIIFTNKGISAFLKLLKSIIKHENKKITKDNLTNYIKALNENSEEKDWEISNLKSKYVGSQGWKEFHRDLVRRIKMKIKTFQD